MVGRHEQGEPRGWSLRHRFSKGERGKFYSPDGELANEWFRASLRPIQGAGAGEQARLHHNECGEVPER